MENESTNKIGIAILSLFLLIGGGILIIVPVYIFHAWVITKVWGWFVVPFFHLPQISLAVAIGFESLILLLNPKSPTSTKDLDMKTLFGSLCGIPLTLLLVAYIAHLYI